MTFIGGTEVKKKILLSSILICFLFSACSEKKNDVSTNQDANPVIVEQENKQEADEKETIEQDEDILRFDLDEYDEKLMQKADGWSNGAMFDCTWRGANISFSDGIMTMKIDQDGENASPKWSGAEYRTKDFYHYGKYEVCMKPIKNDGVVSSFFTYTGP